MAASGDWQLPLPYSARALELWSSSAISSCEIGAGLTKWGSGPQHQVECSLLPVYPLEVEHVKAVGVTVGVSADLIARRIGSFLR